jgi:hypothetical protein
LFLGRLTFQNYYRLVDRKTQDYSSMEAVEKPVEEGGKHAQPLFPPCLEPSVVLAPI